MEDPTEFMRTLELRYLQSSGLSDRAWYKIFYCQLRPAPLLLLGLNPGGDPANTTSDGTRHFTGEIAAASPGLYENGEHDLLDCSWKENIGLKKLLLPLFGNEEKIRRQVVKTNLAFRRSSRATKINMKNAMAEAVPFLADIIGYVKPRVVILTGGTISEFSRIFCRTSESLEEAQKDQNIGHVVFEAAKAELGNHQTTLLIRVDSASQFSWTYERYDVANRILKHCRHMGIDLNRAYET